jgi:hypothetical protein
MFAELGMQPSSVCSKSPPYHQACSEQWKKPILGELTLGNQVNLGTWPQKLDAWSFIMQTRFLKLDCNHYIKTFILSNIKVQWKTPT